MAMQRHFMTWQPLLTICHCGVAPFHDAVQFRYLAPFHNTTLFSDMALFHVMAANRDMAAIAMWCHLVMPHSHWWRGSVCCNIWNACILAWAIYLYVTQYLWIARQTRQGKTRRVHCEACLASSVYISHSLTSCLASRLACLASHLTCEAEVCLARHEVSQMMWVASILASWPSLGRSHEPKISYNLSA